MGTRRRHAPRRTLTQNRSLWALVGELVRASGIPREDAEAVLRRHVREVSGQESTRALSEAEAAEVQRRMRADLPPAEPTPESEPATPKRDGRSVITEDQQRYISGLFRQLGWHDLARRQAFIRRQIGLPWPQTHKHVDQVTHALKAMVLRDVDPADVLRRVQALDGHAGLNRWQEGFIRDVRQRLEQAKAPKRVITTRILDKLDEAEQACGVVDA